MKRLLATAMAAAAFFAAPIAHAFPEKLVTIVVPKPVIVSAGDDADSVTSRYFTPRRCHAAHAVTGAIGVATAFALPGTVASGEIQRAGVRTLAILHPQGRIEVEVSVEGEGQEARLQRAALIRSARKIMQGQLTLPHYLFSEA